MFGEGKDRVCMIKYYFKFKYYFKCRKDSFRVFLVKNSNKINIGRCSLVNKIFRRDSFDNKRGGGVL